MLPKFSLSRWIVSCPEGPVFKVDSLAGPVAAVRFALTSTGVLAVSPLSASGHWTKGGGHLTPAYVYEMANVDMRCCGCLLPGDLITFRWTLGDGSLQRGVLIAVSGVRVAVTSVVNSYSRNLSDRTQWRILALNRHEIVEVNSSPYSCLGHSLDVGVIYVKMILGMREDVGLVILHGVVQHDKRHLLRALLRHADLSSTLLGRVVLVATEHGRKNRSNACCQILVCAGAIISDEDAVLRTFAPPGEKRIYSRFHMECIMDKTAFASGPDDWIEFSGDYTQWECWEDNGLGFVGERREDEYSPLNTVWRSLRGLEHPILSRVQIRTLIDDPPTTLERIPRA